jgi:hypothetical protein
MVGKAVKIFLTTSKIQVKIIDVARDVGVSDSANSNGYLCARRAKHHLHTIGHCGCASAPNVAVWEGFDDQIALAVGIQHRVNEQDIHGVFGILGV